MLRRSAAGPPNQTKLEIDGISMDFDGKSLSFRTFSGLRSTSRGKILQTRGLAATALDVHHQTPLFAAAQEHIPRC